MVDLIEPFIGHKLIPTAQVLPINIFLTETGIAAEVDRIVNTTAAESRRLSNVL
jgi:hypothetical protein